MVYLWFQRVPVCEAGLAIDRVCELFLWNVSVPTQTVLEGVQAYWVEPVEAEMKFSLNVCA